MPKVLDAGYCELIEHWGSDERIVEAARQSTAKGFFGWGGNAPCFDCERAGRLEPDGLFKSPIHLEEARRSCKCGGTGKSVGDEKLLRYLYEHKHFSPFEMAGMVIEVQAPIFVLREWHRHRTQSYSELSARYTTLPNLFYLPSDERLSASQHKVNRQGSAITLLPREQVVERKARIQLAYDTARSVYEGLLESGLSREVARVVIPVAQYSRMRASANLRNWLAFLTLRMAPEAQWEIQQYANEVAVLVRQLFPRTYDLFAKDVKPLSTASSST